jgi:hypothetical protein
MLSRMNVTTIIDNPINDANRVFLLPGSILSLKKNNRISNNKGR